MNILSQEVSTQGCNAGSHGLRHGWGVPWGPAFRCEPDLRLDSYRNRCAALYRAGVLIGHLLVLTDHVATQRGGHLWWRRWEPDREYVEPLVQLRDGSYVDQPLQGAELERELALWSQNKFPLLGKLLDPVWLTQDEALRLAPGVFGVASGVDNNGDIIWSFPDEAPSISAQGDSQLTANRVRSRRSRGYPHGRTAACAQAQASTRTVVAWERRVDRHEIETV